MGFLRLRDLRDDSEILINISQISTVKKCLKPCSNGFTLTFNLSMQNGRGFDITEREYNAILEAASSEQGGVRRVSV